MSQDFIGASDKAMDEIVRRASTLGEKGVPDLSYEEMKQSLRSHLGLHSDDDATYAPRDTSDPLFRRDEAQQQQAAANTASQLVLFLTARTPSDHEFRLIYPHGNEEYEIWGSSKQELDGKEKQLRQMFAA
jgi:hypothetical protein